MIATGALWADVSHTGQKTGTEQSGSSPLLLKSLLFLLGVEPLPGPPPPSAWGGVCYLAPPNFARSWDIKLLTLQPI